MVLDRIKQANDIHKLPLSVFPQLALEIRTFLIRSVSETGGHLASNLGTVELTLALHNVLTFPQDKLIWDVGHQAYTHKILTGRKEEFAHLRMEGGISGFPKREESSCDAFDTGHSSNSISAGLGYVRARDLSGQDYSVISVIGDGALTGGMAYEAMNNAADLKSNFIIVLNDNNMSISPNVGGVSSYLTGLRTAQAYTGLKLGVTKNLEKIPGMGPAMVKTVHRTKSGIKQLLIPGMLFEDMGLTYLGPVDGTDMRLMMRIFNQAKRIRGPVVVHVLTQKGRGYGPARRHPESFHGTGPFDIATGRQRKKKTRPTCTDVFSRELTALGREEPKLVALTAAMPEGTGLDRFQKEFPERFFDVGIAEAHAVTFAAGLSLGGLLPVVAVYSSFLQRAVDQILLDVCMQKLHVVFAVDRAGLVGADGETHQGVFDLSYFSLMPGMTVMAPSTNGELRAMLRFAVKELDGPSAIRYPRGSLPDLYSDQAPPIREGKARLLRRGEGIAILSAGSMLKTCEEVLCALIGEGYNPSLVDVRFVKPFDTELLDELCENTSLFVSVEENVLSGGFGEGVCAYMQLHHRDRRVLPFGIPDAFIPHGSVEGLRSAVGLDSSGILERIRRELEES